MIMLPCAYCPQIPIITMDLMVLIAIKQELINLAKAGFGYHVGR